MGWFDILKLSGADFETDQVDDEDFYGERHSIKENYFYQKPSIGGFTRPHFEAQVSGPKGQDAVGNLEDIRRAIKGGRFGILYYGFTDPKNNSHVVTFRKHKPDAELTGSTPRAKFGNARPTPRMFGHKNGTVLFDSIYPTKGMNRIKSLSGAEFYPIWGMSDHQRLTQVKRDIKDTDESIGRTNVVSDIKEREGGLTPKEAKELETLLGKQRNASKKKIFDKAYYERQARIDELKKKRDGLDDN